MSGDKVLLVVSFGTSYNENRDKTIGAIEREMSVRFPGREIRRAFTSKMIIKKLAERDNEKIDYITEAMERLVDDGIRDVIVQPTHIMCGTEYDDVVREVSEFANDFDKLSIGRPLLYGESDYDDVVDVIEKTILSEVSGEDATVVLMGHGTEHQANSAYSQLAYKLILSGHPNVFVTTVEGFPSFDDTLSLMKGKGYKSVVAHPFMVVAGDHANNDMAGDEDDSLKSIFESEGYDVKCVIKGLGEYKEFRELFVEHAEDAEY